ncbi:MAG: HEAT repeat domain-containing protein [Planctomycetota bacterium]
MVAANQILYGEPDISVAPKNLKELLDAIEQLGKGKYSAAVSWLAELWSDCANSRVRYAAGQALSELGTPESFRALHELIEDAAHWSTRYAVSSVFNEDASTAFDRLLHFFEPARLAQPGGTAVPLNALGTFLPTMHVPGPEGQHMPAWHDPLAMTWLKQDPRWIKLCVKLRKDKQLADVARSVLEFASPELVRVAIEEVLACEGPRVIRTAVHSKGDLLSRYERGEHIQVWNELRQHEALGGKLLEEARAVAKETMARVARNADRISERLAARGWRVALFNPEMRTTPKVANEEIMQRIEKETEVPLPLSLRAFWEMVGGINFVWDSESGHAPDFGLALPMDQLDPLCVYSAELRTISDLESWVEWRQTRHPELVAPFELTLAPDHYHKADTSGGAPYMIQLPFWGVDPIFANEEHELPFVDYLRLSFRWVCFPRLELHSAREDVCQFVETMSEGLEPF